MRRFAEDTKVPVEQSRNEIERVLTKYGATKFAYAIEATQAMIAFEARARRIRFALPLLHKKDGASENISERSTRERDTRRRWRALLLCIKAKLESTESGIETFESAFMAHIVMPDGHTVFEHAGPLIEQSYKSGKSMPLLPAPG